MTSNRSHHSQRPVLGVARRGVAFFVLVVLLSIPFWIVGAMSGRFLPASVPINLPVSALMVVNPCIAAAILEYRERGWAGVKSLREELGCQGYAFPRLLRWSALKAAIVLGIVWGAWHVVPLLGLTARRHGSRGNASA
jgi:hypothetical protein